MSRSGKVRLSWAGARRDFRLGIDELDELDDLCKAGPGFMLAHISAPAGNWKARWLREIVRLGLIGGGMKPDAALTLVERWFDTERNPLDDSLLVCQQILTAAIVGSDEDRPDPLGEPVGEGPPNLSPTAGSASAPSTRSPAPSASPMSAASVSGSSTASTPAGKAATPRARTRHPA